MNNEIERLIDKSYDETTEEDIYNGMPTVALVFNKEKFAKAIIEECAAYIDGWSDSGRYATFGDRLKAQFELKD